MPISTTKGSWASQQPAGGVALAPECHIASYQITAPVDSSAPTGFAVTIPGLTVMGTRVVGLVPKSASAAAIANYVVVTADTLTFNTGATNLVGTEIWDVTLMTQC